MVAGLIILIAIVWVVLGYLIYSRRVDREIIQSDPSGQPPR